MDYKPIFIANTQSPKPPPPPPPPPPQPSSYERQIGQINYHPSNTYYA